MRIITDHGTFIVNAKALEPTRPPINVRDEAGTHVAKSGTGISDKMVVQMVTDHKEAVRQNRDGWEAIRAKEAARGWMGRLFPSRDYSVPPPIPAPLPFYILARARELGIL